MAATGRTTVELEILERRAVDRELTRRVTLGVGLPKGDRARWLVEKATELGVWRLVPLRTEHAVARPTAAALGRLRHAVIEAAKQCGRNRLMEITEPQSWEAYLTDAVESPQGRSIDACQLLAHPSGGGRRPSTPIWPTFPADQPIRLAVGPEGGLTEPEVALAEDHGWQRVDLGRRTLRVETAALALVVLAADR